MKCLGDKRIFRKRIYIFLLLPLMLLLMGKNDCDGDGAPKQYDYDLAAVDWRYEINGPVIKFWGIVKNVGKKTMSGPWQYTYTIYVSGGGISPKEYWRYEPPIEPPIKPGETAMLTDSWELPVHSQNKYDFSFIIKPKQDQNLGNNLYDVFVGASLDWIKKSGKARKPGE